MTDKAQPTTLETLLDTNGAAKILGIPARTIVKWRSTGENNIPFVKIGRAVRYSPRELAAYISRHTVGGVQ